MPLPETERILYENNPLQEVICQIRFSPILKIDAEIPADFQEQIRRQFPNYTETSNIKLEISPDIEGEVPTEILRQVLKSTPGKNHEFLSEDGSWKVNLARTFFSLSTGSYSRWEDFRDAFSLPFNALLTTYKIEHSTRIGLRYIDVIRRSKLGIENEPWRELVSAPVAGLLISEDIGDSVQSLECKHELSLSDNESTLRIITRLAREKESNEIVFIIDSDFFINKKIDIHETITKMDYFNVRASRLIQWAITPKLHIIMGPSKL